MKARVSVEGFKVRIYGSGFYSLVFWMWINNEIHFSGVRETPFRGMAPIFQCDIVKSAA